MKRLSCVLCEINSEQHRMRADAKDGIVQRLAATRTRRVVSNELHDVSPDRLNRVSGNTGKSCASNSHSATTLPRRPPYTPFAFASINDDLGAALAVNLASHAQAGKVFERAAARRTINGICAFRNNSDQHVHPV
jgi:hypothetical protein